MLRSSEWGEVSSTRGPLAGERIRGDLAQPLPFRDGVFDLCFSVSAVHYLVQDSLARTAAERISALTSSLRKILTQTARPCTLQAYLTRDSNAVESFRQVALRDGWGLCELVVDQSHGQKAERDFLYLSQQAEDRPPRCVLYEHAQATCALALESWTYRTGAPHPVRLDAAHRAWLVREHDRYARRMLRLHKRCETGGSLDHSAPLGPEAQTLADRLAAVESTEDEEARLSMILNVLHT
ncbi:unnamed protein product [Durusdinium trenchii]